MPNKIDSQRVLFQGGLNTSENFLLLSNDNPGFATRLINYETALSGGYRRIDGYIPIDSDFDEVTSVADPAEGPVLGIWGFVAPASTFTIYAARKLVAGATYGIYKYVAVTGWEIVNTGTTQTATGVDLVRTETFATQTGNMICIVDGVNEALLFNGTTWYQINNPAAGGSGAPGGDQALEAPAIVTYFKDTLFLSGDPSYPGVVAYSAPLDPFTWTAAAGAGQQVPGFSVVQIKAFRDEMYIFGTQAIKKSIADEAVGFVLQDVTNNIGCIARDSVQEVNSNIIFFAPDGVRTVAGTEKINDVEVGPISEHIHNTITTVIDTYDLIDLRSTIIRNKTQFRYFISNDVNFKNDAYGIIGCVRHTEGIWEFMEINGFEVSCAWSGYDEDGIEVVLHGSPDGEAFYEEEGNDFDGSDITSICVTPYLDLGDTTIRKLFRRIDLFTRSEGSFSGSLEVNYDWDSGNIILPSAYSFSDTGEFALYDSGAVFDDDVLYAGSRQPFFKINIQGSAHSIQLGITVSGAFASHTLQGFVINFSVKGRE